MGFFNLHKPLVYKYKPIYYDPKKEAKKAREESAVNAESKTPGSTYKPSLKRGSFREMADQNRNSKHVQSRKSNIRLIIILLILFAIAYFLIK